MKKILTILGVAALMLCLASMAAAQEPNGSPISKGKVLLSIQATELTATAVDTGTYGSGDYPSFVSGGVVGGKATIAYGLSDQWAINGAFLWATGYEKVEPPASVGTEEKLSISALGVRVGLDRHVQLAEWFSFYGGPGLQWTSAKAEFTPAPYENPKASTFSLSGRIGVFVRLSQKFGLSWDLGQQFTMTSKKVVGKANQLTSSHDGNLGVTVAF